MSAAKQPPPAVMHEKLLALCDVGVLQFDLSGQLNYASPSTVQLLGYVFEGLPEVLGELIYDITVDPDAERLQKILSGVQADTVAIQPVEVQLKTARNSLTWVEASCQVLRDDFGQPEGHAIYLRNIEKQKLLELQLAATVRTDKLTGLYNTKAFEDAAKREWAVALREQTPVTLIKAALDGFTDLGDDIDQAAFENCICTVANTLKDTARRPADMVARVGAGEFAMLLPRTHEMGAQTVSAYVHLTVQDLNLNMPVKSAGKQPVTVSVGATCFVSTETRLRANLSTFLNEADECLLRARERGGNQVVLTTKTLGSA